MRTWCALALFSFVVYWSLFFPPVCRTRPLIVTREDFACVAN